MAKRIKGIAAILHKKYSENIPKSNIPQIVDIKGYEGLYKINIEGKIFKILKDGSLAEMSTYMKDAHKGRRAMAMVVGLTDPKTHKKKTFTINNLMKVNYFHCDDVRFGVKHKNNSISDCSFWNLELLSRCEIGNRTGAKSRQRKVLKVNSDTNEIIEVYPSIREAGRQNFCSYQTISDYCNNLVKKPIFTTIKFMWEENYDYEVGEN